MLTGYTSYQMKEIKEKKTGVEKHPFSHQLEAFGALSNTLPTPIAGYKGTMLVLPTGGGKTYTAVNWICRNIISKGIKVLWLAQSATLLDQAAQTFKSELHHIIGRDSINMRVVSSSDHHANAGSIVPSDDIVICTTQTAIRAYSTEAINCRGNKMLTPFRQYIDSFSDDEFFVVVDEAHHTPAFGCRTLLISLRESLKNLYILGLTATPIHNDKRISGWLTNIYSEGICYKADINILQTNSILSVPVYIEKQTGIEFAVDDKLYKRLVDNHKDLPEAIIEKLANDSARNNYIVSDYVNNKDNYGKTLIFADRWFQCEYIVEKLKSQGIRANAVYSKIENSDELFADSRGRRSNKENETIMKGFREGEYDVLVNVKMLTEGVDVPDVKTVMITRQTTSPILFTQMIGRALRGRKAGGGEDKEHANIVLFMDNWKRLLPFVEVGGGGQDSLRTPKQGRNPYEIISIHLVKLASADILYENTSNTPFLKFVPLGWYSAEYTVSNEEWEELIACNESILIYEFNSQKYENLIEALLKSNLDDWSDESLLNEDIMPTIMSLAEQYFEDEDNFDGMLYSNIIEIIRHIAQNGSKPVFLNFNERNSYDLDRIAGELINCSPREGHTYLKNTFNDSAMLWSVLYGNFNYFKKAYDQAVNRLLNEPDDMNPVEGMNEEPVTLLTDAIRQQVYKRDNYKCVCCSKERRKGVSLEIDHILPLSMGGKNVPSNLQTLCRQCNGIKGVNEINYRSIISPLKLPKEMILFDTVNSDYIENIMARIVNHIYHCKAFCNLEYSQRRNGKNYHIWVINLYHGNNPQWLEKYNSELLNYVKYELGWNDVEKIIIKN